ncbi:hypothetical protein PAPYR_6403 [Paratrimastix pyriformis]|uniref:SET domain-containing protein n=1 Tax=Paratrimastix pyriformis TaxID=342808 RepID=A0ABQ8UGU3_9EUKA|nr:hypothetical protein PAPYR_6403 [Paratrimastix pyriformis]
MLVNVAPGRGRYVVAAQDLPEGSVVLEDPAVMLMLNPSQRKAHCAHCTQLLTSQGGIPCPCCHTFMYCSEECLHNDAPLHAQECHLQRLKVCPQRNDIERLITFRLLSLCTENDGLAEGIAEARRHNVTPQLGAEELFVNPFSRLFSMVDHEADLSTEAMASHWARALHMVHDLRAREKLMRRMPDITEVIEVLSTMPGCPVRPLLDLRGFRNLPSGEACQAAMEEELARYGCKGFGSMADVERSIETLLALPNTCPEAEVLEMHTANLTPAQQTPLHKLLTRSLRHPLVRLAARLFMTQDSNVHTIAPDIGFGMHKAGSLANHSCHPTAEFAHSTRGTLRVVTRRPVRAGEELTYNYTILLDPYAARQEHLAAYCFTCCCERCALHAATDQPYMTHPPLGSKPTLRDLDVWLGGWLCPHCGAVVEDAVRRCPCDETHNEAVREMIMRHEGQLAKLDALITDLFEPFDYLPSPHPTTVSPLPPSTLRARLSALHAALAPLSTHLHPCHSVLIEAAVVEAWLWLSLHQTQSPPSEPQDHAAQLALAGRLWAMRCMNRAYDRTGMRRAVLLAALWAVNGEPERAKPLLVQTAERMGVVFGTDHPLVACVRGWVERCVVVQKESAAPGLKPHRAVATATA